MSPRARTRFDSILGFLVASLTPLAMWVYLRAVFPDLPEFDTIAAEQPDTLMSFLLNRILMFSVLIQLPLLILAIFLKRYEMARIMVIIGVVYAIVALIWRWQWL